MGDTRTEMTGRPGRPERAVQAAGSAGQARRLTQRHAESVGSRQIHAIIPAGGAGTRLWPLSRRHRPKFLLDLTGSGRSLLQATVARLAPVAATTTVVTGAAHLEAVADQLPGLPPDNLIAEPSPRDSMAAIGLAAAIIAYRYGREAVVGSFAADHVITDEAAFTDAVTQAAVLAEAGWVVTIGIEATGPSTAFGYIRAGRRLGVPGAPQGYQVLGFTEKPDAATAQAYLDAGGYQWNAGMFVARAGVLLDHLAAQRPDLAAGIEEVAQVWDTPRRSSVVAQVWPGLERIAIDHAIAEPVAAEGGVAVVPASMGWDDVGGYDSLAQLVPTRTEGPAAGAAVLDFALAGQDGTTGRASRPAPVPEDGRAAVAASPPAPAREGTAAQGGSETEENTEENEDEEVEVFSSPGSLVAAASGRTVVLLGVPGVVVVDTPDALLVTTPDHAQEVKGVVDRLADHGRDELL
ncbi:mannose-1-phosphate guanylyltransferase [Actinomyces sp. 2119]|uniref:mannose-1-phosphate guanylyltransferase n=1 Tax=Actinomyces sp. 2119 TaxID=2321393 RepID=UPI00217614D0|nr:mannose-1-phosphate guanylyltransferase [Actinomyces sp. 2119]